MERKVRLHHVDVGFCLEVWEVERMPGRKQYYIGRETVGAREWYTLFDAPNGYCEPSTTIRADVVFILCDDDWNELTRDSNDRTKFPLSKTMSIEEFVSKTERK